MIEVKDLKNDIESKIINSEKVLFIPHKNADFDAIGSAIGLSLIPKKLKKQSYIIMNDPMYAVDPGVKIIVDEVKKEYDIINNDKYKSIAHPNDLFILTDVNKKYLISIVDYINNPDNVIVIDHHDSDKNTVESNSIYIDTDCSSASEIVVSLLNNCKIKIPSNVANYLYAGIYLDTAKLTKNCTAETMKAAAKLLECGAKINRVNELFKEDFLSDRKVQNLINNIQMINCMIAFIEASEDEEYSREEIAKAADYALKYGADAAFAIGRIEDEIVSISGRSTEKINIGSIMSKLDGGGNPYSGASKIENTTVEEVGKRLKKVLKPSYYIDNIDN